MSDIPKGAKGPDTYHLLVRGDSERVALPAFAVDRYSVDGNTEWYFEGGRLPPLLQFQLTAASSRTPRYRTEYVEALRETFVIEEFGFVGYKGHGCRLVQLHVSPETITRPSGRRYARRAPAERSAEAVAAD